MNVIFHEDAEAELVGQIEYYEDKVPGLGLDFLKEIEQSVSLIAGSPTVWPLRGLGCRRYLINRFPFSIFYLLKPDTVWIVAIAHTSRRPYYWKERLVD